MHYIPYVMFLDGEYWGIHYLCETSAKTGQRAQEVFIEAAKCLYEEHLKYKDMKLFGFFKKKEKAQVCVQDHAEDECMCVVKAVICG